MPRYKLELKNQYARSGRQIKNIRGTLVVFYDGVASNVGEDIATAAKRQHYIAKIAEVEEQQTVTSVVEDTTAIEETVEEIVEEEEEVVEETIEEEPVDSVEVSENVVASTDETEDGVLTREEIESLYDEHGTWTAVADHLDISTTTLKKYRDEVGL